MAERISCGPRRVPTASATVCRTAEIIRGGEDRAGLIAPNGHCVRPMVAGELPVHLCAEAVRRSVPLQQLTHCGQGGRVCNHADVISTGDFHDPGARRLADESTGKWKK